MRRTTRHTTLSPVLFDIQLNDIKLLNSNSNITCYADDAMLICSGITCREVVFQTIEACLLSIKNWPSENSLFRQPNDVANMSLPMFKKYIGPTGSFMNTMRQNTYIMFNKHLNRSQLTMCCK